MSKGILEFNLPEEQTEFELAQKGANYRYLIDDVLNELRSKSKYSDQTEINIEDLQKLIHSGLEDINAGGT